ncbi:MAG TPA: S-methyl-5-thioribose-1-phosphate isomerase [candidate division Zixibacteria bacterium]|nr:S-methyl-5-thioribose-1-phosphate isomerase [candidate division Zixibacteria bacterium]
MITNIQSKLGFSPVKWDNGSLVILNQRLLPEKEDYRKLTSVAEVADSIRNLSVRGAPLIGVVAAYGLCLVSDLYDESSFAFACEILKNTRPTAINLAWAIDRLKAVRNGCGNDSNIRDSLTAEAIRIHREDAEMCAKIGEIGAKILSDNCRILTHCNAGALATGGIGTALGVIYTAYFSGKKIEVWVDETRPILQGARLTAWELSKAGVPYTLISDNVAGSLMAQGRVDIIITGADRVAANLDFANKIGTYSLAVLAHHHKIPFYAAAPSSTFDPNCPNGKSIMIENRSPDEVRTIGSQVIAPNGAPVYNPAFDVTPHELVTGIITEKGILRS